jgi:hypothetical protein
MTRQEYRLSEEEVQELIAAMKPTPVMYVSGGINIGGNVQENANAAWRTLGERRGFVWDTVRPVNGKTMHWITAEPKP